MLHILSEYTLDKGMAIILPFTLTGFIDGICSFVQKLGLKKISVTFYLKNRLGYFHESHDCHFFLMGGKSPASLQLSMLHFWSLYFWFPDWQSIAVKLTHTQERLAHLTFFQHNKISIRVLCGGWVTSRSC